MGGKLVEFLVSVQNEREFGQAVRAGIDWIDLKNPHAGSLGAPSIEQADQVAQALDSLVKSRADQGTTFRTSIALGEWNDASPVRNYLPKWEFDYAKVGLSHSAHHTDWKSAVGELADQIGTGKLILVFYADSILAGSPSFDSVLAVASELNCKYILVDTFAKNGKRLTDWCSPIQLKRMIDAAHSAGLSISIAGSLRFQDFSPLAQLEPDLLAVRGAVCRGGLRRDELCSEKLAELVEFRDREINKIKNEKKNVAINFETNDLEPNCVEN